METLSMTRILFSLAALCLLSAPIVTANDTPAASKKATGGLSVGDDVAAFLVTKVAGANDDNVKNGATLCYRCKYGQRPMVMVFTHTTGDAVPKLVEKLDAAVAKHSSEQLKGFVTLIGNEPEELTRQAKTLATQFGDKNVPIVVAKDSKNGPASYKLDPGTAVTVLIVNHSQVVARHNFAADQVDVAAVMKEVDEMLN